MPTVRAATSTPSVGTGGAPPVLREGSRGHAVADLQRALKAAGFDPGADDGDFGPRTRAAVLSFQRARGLEADGVVGAQTRAALQAPATPATSPTTPATAPAPGGFSATGPTLRRGCRGPEVAQLQRALQEAGFNPGSADGEFGPQTKSAVVAFQRSQGLGPDGVVGPRTREALARPDGFQPGSTTPTTPGTPTPGAERPGLAPRHLTERQKFDHYAAIVRAHGGQVNPNGQPTVLGLRGVTLDGATHELTSARSYDDVFVVLTADGRALELRGATHPGQNSSTAAPDVTGDGRGDVGTIRPGSYLCKPNGQHAGDYCWHVQTLDGSGRIPGWRDTNHDGRFTDAERGASEGRGDTLTGVLFHQGNTSSPSSIGCQTLSPAEYDRFMAALGGRRATFTYTLVDAR